MKNKNEPWNDQSAPIVKNGARLTLIITISTVALVVIATMVFAYLSKGFFTR